MSDAQSLSGSKLTEASRVKEFKQLFRIILIVEALFALAMLIFPDHVARIFGIPFEQGLVIWAVMLLWTIMFQFPAMSNPVHNRIPIVIGIIGRVILAITFLILCTWILAAVSLVSAIALYVLFQRMVYAVLASRP